MTPSDKPLNEKEKDMYPLKGIRNRMFYHKDVKEHIERAEKRLKTILNMNGELTEIQINKIWKEEFGSFK